jgi:hypothetical protein
MSAACPSHAACAARSASPRRPDRHTLRLDRGWPSPLAPPRPACKGECRFSRPGRAGRVTATWTATRAASRWPTASRLGLEPRLLPGGDCVVRYEAREPMTAAAAPCPAFAATAASTTSQAKPCTAYPCRPLAVWRMPPHACPPRGPRRASAHARGHAVLRALTRRQMDAGAGSGVHESLCMQALRAALGADHCCRFGCRAALTPA